MTKKHCLIFGGGGFIGSHLAEKLVAKGHVVTVFSRRPVFSYPNLSTIWKKIKFIQGDFNDLKSVDAILQPGNIVFDLVSSSVPFSSIHSPFSEITTHILAHTQLIQCACKKGVGKIIYFSSGGGVYGDKSYFPIAETASTIPASPHAISKLTLEYFLNYFCKVHDTPFLIYRLGNPYGPRQTPGIGFGVIPTLFSHVLQNKNPILFNQGNSVRDFIFIEDLIDAILKSFSKKSPSSLYNLGSGEGVSIKSLWQDIKKVTKTDLQPIFKPKRPIDVNATVLDIEKFKEDFHWQPKTKIITGLKKTWKAYKKHHAT